MVTGNPVPRYLLPPSHPKHVPPHVVAFDMIRQYKTVRGQVQRSDRQAEEEAGQARAASMRAMQVSKGVAMS